ARNPSSLPLVRQAKPGGGSAVSDRRGGRHSADRVGGRARISLRSALSLDAPAPIPLSALLRNPRPVPRPDLRLGPPAPSPRLLAGPHPAVGGGARSRRGVGARRPVR